MTHGDPFGLLRPSTTVARGYQRSEGQRCSRAIPVIHSGQFTCSTIHGDVCVDQTENDEWRLLLRSAFWFDHRSVQLAFDSLKAMLQRISSQYSSTVTSPRWNSFKGVHRRWKDKIRVNNVIWRGWHRQVISGIPTSFCRFVCSVDDPIHQEPQAVVLEGCYWRRKYDTVREEYRQWRMYATARRALEAQQRGAVVGGVCVVPDTDVAPPSTAADQRVLEWLYDHSHDRFSGQVWSGISEYSTSDGAVAPWKPSAQTSCCDSSACQQQHPSLNPQPSPVTARDQLDAEIALLRTQVSVLHEEIVASQLELNQLADLAALRRKLFQSWVDARFAQDNDKTMLFVLLLKPLYESFMSSVSVSSLCELYHTARTWQHQWLSSARLRHSALSLSTALSDISSILSNAEQLP